VREARLLHNRREKPDAFLNTSMILGGMDPVACWHLSCIPCCTGFIWKVAAKSRIDCLECSALPP
jgi:hypothetical protein